MDFPAHWKGNHGKTDRETAPHSNWQVSLRVYQQCGLPRRRSHVLYQPSGVQGSETICQDLTADKWQSWDLNPCQGDSEHPAKEKQSTEGGSSKRAEECGDSAPGHLDLSTNSECLSELSASSLQQSPRSSCRRGQGHCQPAWVPSPPCTSHGMSQGCQCILGCVEASGRIPAGPGPPAGDRRQPADTQYGSPSGRAAGTSLWPTCTWWLHISFRLINTQSSFFSRQMEAGLTAPSKRAILVG